MLLRLLLLSFVILFASSLGKLPVAKRAVKGGNIDLCEYLLLIGRSIPSCSSARQGLVSTRKAIEAARKKGAVTPSALERMIREVERKEAIKNILKDDNARSLAVCKPHSFKNCEETELCPSQIVCLESNSLNPCCFASQQNIKNVKKDTNSTRGGYAPLVFPPPESFGSCPSGQLPYGPCPVGGTTCRISPDCPSPSAPLCCPSGCGYSVCVRKDGSRIQRRQTTAPPDPLKVSADVCPPKESIPVSCNQPKAISWCTLDIHCKVPRPDRISRHCCPTRCGYNVCIGIRNSTSFFIG